MGEESEQGGDGEKSSSSPFRRIKNRFDNKLDSFKTDVAKVCKLLEWVEGGGAQFIPPDHTSDSKDKIVSKSRWPQFFLKERSCV